MSVSEPFEIDWCSLGRGLFARRALAEGEVVLTFTGREITLAEALAKGDSHVNVLQIGDGVYIDLEPPGVYANHSCDPNAGVIADRILVALKPIAVGEEVRFDYSTTMWDGTWALTCQCNSARCRGVVRDFPELPAERRAEYLRIGAVQTFIARHFRE